MIERHHHDHKPAEQVQRREAVRAPIGGRGGCVRFGGTDGQAADGRWDRAHGGPRDEAMRIRADVLWGGNRTSPPRKRQRDAIKRYFGQSLDWRSRAMRVTWSSSSWARWPAARILSSVASVSA